MWASIAFMMTLQLAPQPISQIKLTNDRVTHNTLGWERKDSKSPRLKPGDMFFLLFDIEGLPVGDDGRVRYTIGLELTDNKANKVVFSKPSEEQEVTASLGGKKLAASAQTGIGTETPAGNYTLKVIVGDPINKKSETLSRSFDVMPVELGFARVIPTFDDKMALAAPSAFFAGQSLFVNFAPVGFTLDAKKEPNLTVKMRVLDQATGKSVLEKPFLGGATMVPEDFKKIIPMQFILSLNRPGKFRIALEVTDNLTKKSAEQTLDFEVLEAR